MPVDAVKAKLLADLCIQYWEYDTKPDFSDPDALEANSPEKLLFDIYDSLKEEVLESYPWRSVIKFTTLTTTTPSALVDDKYSRSVNMPLDFLKEDAFWYDSKRNNPLLDGVEIVGKIAKTNLEKFTMSYISKDVVESNMDSWLISYLKIYIAANAADISGLSAERKAQLLQQADNDFWSCSNTDWKMANKHNDALEASINEFVIS